MPRFPKPEEGVRRFEVWTRAMFDEGHWLQASTLLNKDHLSDAQITLAIATDLRVPAYIYDRKTGEVIATNEEQLKSND